MLKTCGDESVDFEDPKWLQYVIDVWNSFDLDEVDGTKREILREIELEVSACLASTNKDIAKAYSLTCRAFLIFDGDDF